MSHTYMSRLGLDVSRGIFAPDKHPRGERSKGRDVR